MAFSKHRLRVAAPEVALFWASGFGVLSTLNVYHLFQSRNKALALLFGSHADGGSSVRLYGPDWPNYFQFVGDTIPAVFF